MSEKTIWILEDEIGCQFVYKNILDIRYKLVFFSSLTELEVASKSFTEAPPALLIADLRLTDGTFLSVLATPERRRFISCPFIIVSSIDDVDSLRFCFESGATDYLVKPFQKSELIVKVERVLLLGTKKEFFEDLFPANCSIELTSKQKKILSIFLRSPQKTVSRKEIMALAWGSDRVDPKTIDVHIYNLRKKLNPCGLEIQYTGENAWRLLDNRMNQSFTANIAPRLGQ